MHQSSPFDFRVVMDKLTNRKIGIDCSCSLYLFIIQKQTKCTKITTTMIIKTRSHSFLAFSALVTFIIILSALSFLSLTPQSHPLHHQTRKLATSFPDNFPNRNLVLDLMQLSDDIYAVDEQDIPTFDAISDAKFEGVLWIEAEFSTEVMIIKSREDQDFPPIVVFRGSEELDDWKANTNIGLVKSKFQNAPDSVQMHRGFQNALFSQENVIGKVEEKILELVGESGEVIVTGHSLG